MLDFRYHAISLAAVFLALVIGILAGIGISGRGFVDDAQRNDLNRQIAALEERAQSADDRADELARRQEAAQKFVVSAYPVLADRRLRGKRVAVLVVGSVDQTLDWVLRALRESGAGNPVRMRAVKVPLELDRIEGKLQDSDAFGGYVGDDQLGDLGRDLGRELAGGGETPLWNALAPNLIEERQGDSAEAADAVVVVRSADPQEAETARFLAGLYSGVASTGEPVVGAEVSRVLESAIPVFQRHRLSTVDGIDTPLGRLALVLLLGGAEPGDYGVRDTADRILPPIEPLPTAGG